MARCSTCSAPLPANSNRCVYCQVRSDVDLHAKYNYQHLESSHNRICPNCDTRLTTINLETGATGSAAADNLQIERCESCFGLFFDPGEIEEFLEKSVSNVVLINQKHMLNISNDRYQKENTIRYRKCPVCQSLMQRSNYAHRSGVVVDRCYQHGIWLDNGEITHLLEWKKAGGQMLHETLKKKQEENKKAAQFNTPPDFKQVEYQQKYNKTFDLGDDLLETISNLVYKLF